MNLDSCTRAEWDEEQRLEAARPGGAHGFDPTMPWRLAYWYERCGIVLFWFVMWGAAFPGLLIGALLMLGMMMEGATTYNVERERCQKRAVTPYEYAQCPR